MLDFLDNKSIQGTGHLAQGYAKLILDRNFKGAYEDVVTAFALFRASDIVPLAQKLAKEFLADVDAKTEVFAQVRDQKQGG